MACSRAEVIVRSVNVAWNNRSKQAIVLFKIASIQYIYQPLCIAIPEIGIMRQTVVNLKLRIKINRIVSAISFRSMLETKTNGLNCIFFVDMDRFWPTKPKCKFKKKNVTIVSSIGYVVLSGNIQVDKQETTFSTFVSWHTSKTLSLINIFFL